MRRLDKQPEPAVLRASRTAWTAAYQAAHTSGAAKPSPWRHPDILATLRIETRAKCAYCEAIIADVSYPHVEHILPKSKRPDLVVSWPNLTLACQKCNTNKADYYEPTAPLVHPYEDEVEKHVSFRGPAIVARLDSASGERTIGRLELQRAPLLMERMRRIEGLHQRLCRWETASGPDREMFADLVREAIDDHAEFAQCLREFAASMGFPVES